MIACSPSPLLGGIWLFWGYGYGKRRSGVGSSLANSLIQPKDALFGAMMIKATLTHEPIDLLKARTVRLGEKLLVWFVR
jgi:hypothetical protein